MAVSAAAKCCLCEACSKIPSAACVDYDSAEFRLYGIEKQVLSTKYLVT